jgi:hypothetical protein
MASRRCWSLEGSVFRSILLLLPRVVAGIWYDPGGPDAVRYTGAGDKGLREIFRERLETMLPGVSRMDFRVAPSSLPIQFPGKVNTDPVQSKRPAAPQQGDPRRTDFWHKDDVMITAKGLYFPPLPKLPPTAAQIFDAIATGRAGNPVFTSTYRCED